MGFLTNLFKKKESESVMLIDIGASSVAGACVQYKKSSLPTVLYTRRLPIDIRKDETHEFAMLRALYILCGSLLQEASPILLRASGSGSIDKILISIDSPWQETSVRTESFEKKEPFIFTKDMVDRALEETRTVSQNKTISDESIIGTILNGYETLKPYGRKIHRASIIILTSLISKEVANSIISVIRKAYHTNKILPITDSSLRYQAMRHAFPHQHDMLILDATGPVTSVSLIRRGLFVGIVDVQCVTGSNEWIENVKNEFSTLAKQYPLPRTIFLLAQELEIPSLQKKLSESNLGQLWLSDNPPTFVTVLASHLTNYVKQMTPLATDLPLLLMAIYYQHRI